jgi:hypothetical protein
MTKHILLLAALGLALSAIGAQADSYTTVTTSGDGETRTAYTKYSDGSRDKSTTHFVQEPKPTPIPTPTPMVPAATNPQHAPRHVTPAYQAPARVATEVPVTVIEGALTPEQIRRLVNGE